MTTTPRTETTALIAAMEHWAKAVSKNGGIAAITIQEGADRLRELETELAKVLARLDWLGTRGPWDSWFVPLVERPSTLSGDIRDAIDAAMKEGGK
jgi:hypothetical protein